MKKVSDCMLVTKAKQVIDSTDTNKLELYRLISEGYETMQEGRV